MNRGNTPPAQNSVVIASLFLVGLFGAVMVFWPSLSGPFLLDDKTNLRSLGANGGINSFDDFFSFVLNGKSSKLGRPLTLATFVANARDWPALAWPFKFTNLMLHLLNGILLFVLSFKLVALVERDERRAQLIAACTFLIWILHPLQLSTMMTVVQRMTQLSAMFVILSLLAYLHGRELVTAHVKRGYIWMSGAVGLGLALAVLSKENGVLLPLLILVVETVLIKRNQVVTPAFWRSWRLMFLGAPIALLAAYVVIKMPAFLAEYEYNRPFDMPQRLLTEARVIVDYLFSITMPWRSGMGVFHDDFAISTGILAPLSTLFAVGAVACLILCAIALRRKHPILTFAILWFFAGHLLESTFIPLELYFEHRNYLPMFGPCLGVVYYAFQLRGASKQIALTGLAVFVLAEAAVSYQSSGRWGNEEILSAQWVQQHPGSLRARQFRAQYLVGQKRYPEALANLHQAVHYNPMRLAPQMQILQFSCFRQTIERAEIEKTIRAAATARRDNGSANVLQVLNSYISNEKCPLLTYQDLHKIADNMLANPAFHSSPKGTKKIYWYKSLFYLNEDNVEQAIWAADRAYDAHPDYHIPLYQAAWLISQNEFSRARRYLDLAKRSTGNTLKAIQDRAVERTEMLFQRQLRENQSQDA